MLYICSTNSYAALEICITYIRHNLLFREEISKLLSDMDADLQSRLFRNAPTRQRQGRTMFGDDDEGDQEVVMKTRRTLLESVTKTEEIPSFAESLEIQKRWKRDGKNDIVVTSHKLLGVMATRRVINRGKVRFQWK